MVKTENQTDDFIFYVFLKASRNVLSLIDETDFVISFSHPLLIYVYFLHLCS